MTAHAPDHEHATSIEAMLELLNTASFDDGVPRDSLGAVEDAVALLVGLGLAHEDALWAQARLAGEGLWLARVRSARDAVRRAWDAQVEGRAPDQASLDVVNAVLREAPRIELVAGDECCAIGHRHTADDPTGEALARLVEPFVAAIAAGQTARFRICANDGCRWVFEDTSRAGRRRWCDMTSCGNVAKVRRYRARRRVVAADDGQPASTGPQNAQSRSSSARTSVAKRVIDSSS